MRRTKAGAVFIALGVLALIAGRISYKTHKELITVGPYKTSLDTRKVIPLRPWGALAVLGGIILIVAGKRV